MWKIPPVSKGGDQPFLLGAKIWTCWRVFWECFIAKSMIFIKLPKTQFFI
jgi:hypothetical protein